jgi:orotidine-5'-phosphate decarboxylase
VTFSDLIVDRPSTDSSGEPSIANNKFFQSIENRQVQAESLLCVGLDPDASRFPARILKEADPIFCFNKAIIDATADLVCCFKPQFAHFAALGAEKSLEKTISYIKDLDIPVILDAKRGDIGSTAERYATEAFERYGADAVTINPYLGYDSMEPFLSYRDKGIFILCRTSNPGGADLQNLKLENGQSLYEHVAGQASSQWNGNNNIALVTGATQPSELARIREITGDMPFLLPGIGAQGGDVASSLKAGKGGGLIVSSSRAVLYASDGDDFDEAARQVANSTRTEINEHKATA